MESNDYNFKDLLLAIVILAATLIWSFNRDDNRPSAKDQSATKVNQVGTSAGISSID